jgi:hypothetical protein
MLGYQDSLYALSSSGQDVTVSIAVRRRFERLGHVLPTLDLTVVVCSILGLG